MGSREITAGDFTCRLNDDDTLDEIVGTGFIHLEQLDERSWFLSCGHGGHDDIHMYLSGPLRVGAFVNEPQGIKRPSAYHPAVPAESDLFDDDFGEWDGRMADLDPETRTKLLAWQKKLRDAHSHLVAVFDAGLFDGYAFAEAANSMQRRAMAQIHELLGPQQYAAMFDGPLEPNIGIIDPEIMASECGQETPSALRARQGYGTPSGPELRAAYVVPPHALREALIHIHATAGGTALGPPDVKCDEENCPAQRAITEIHCTTLNMGFPE